MNTIHLIPNAGLGNRLRVISSVYNYCIKNGIELIVHWHRQHGLNAPFYSLFNPIPNLKIVDCNLFDYFNYNDPSKFNLFIPRFINKIEKRTVYYGLGLNKLDSLEINQPITISTYSQQGDLYPLSELFQPVKEIQQVIDEFQQEMGENAIGCHIRRTDNATAIKNSSFDKFEKKIEEQIKKDPDTKIFICSDDANVKSFFREKYGNSIISYNSALTRNSLKGIRDAVIELWLLSLTKEIWGSYWSSYTDMAISLHNTKYVIIK